MKLLINKTISIFLGVLLLGLLPACEDFLDRQEDEAMTFEKIWKNRSTVREYWRNTMSFLPDDANDFNFSPWLGASDEGTVTYNRDFRWINFGSWNPTSVPYERMTHYYKGIRECNVFLANVDRTSDPLVSEEEIQEWKVQTRFARAYYYFLMMRNYGPVFLIGDEELDFTATTEQLERPRNTWDECVNYVVSEMDDLAGKLPEEWQSSSDYGLATRGAALAVISRLKLYSARTLFNGNELYSGITNPDGTRLFPAFNGEKWADAAHAAKAVIDLGIYELNREGNGNPYEDWMGITNEHWNSEIIWSTGYKSRYSMGVHTVPTGVPGTAYGGVGPTQQQVDAYAMQNGRYPITGYDEDGTPIVDNTSGYPADEFAKEQFTNPAFDAGYNTASDDNENMWPVLFKDREPRFYMTVFWSDSYWKHGDRHTLISFAKGGNGNKSHDYPKSGYIMHRFYDHSLPSHSGQWGNIVFPTFRLGEIYLNFIEAVLECKKNGISIPVAYETEAMSLWADLRDRAGMSSITDAYPGASTEQLIDLIRKERRVELAFENHRYFDTRTWMIAEETDGGPMYGMNINAEAESGTDTPDLFWQRSIFETRVFQPNHYLYPFSQREIDRNSELIQNYGW
ncbi:RagB/SusD family nutrient uptake outer membrane protein [Marinilabilia salmonicolor]|uniref:RagB/SusD family nutrient uptake outer membrane protein n=1 Tax=Marinilabilia salmonicolor TaxID=989 RepID=UPI00029B4138|nr:RagB/SusD family nutrient uptake outer membrane protein [Marinilabilia salmonicolor]